VAARSPLVRFGFRHVAAGAGVLALVACHDKVIAPAPPANIELVAAGATQATVGSTLTPAPTFVVRDTRGKAIAGIAVTVEVVSGDGTLKNAPRRTISGATSIGEWQLGTRAGQNVVSIKAGSLPPLQITVLALADAPSALAPIGDGQSALAGTTVAQPLGIKVSDRFGNGVANLDVTLTAGGGDLSSTTQRTDANGVATGVQWRLGRRGGDQQLQAIAGGLSATLSALIKSDYNPIVRFYGTPPSPEIQAAFTAAAARVHAMVISDVPDVILTGFDLGRCGVAAPPLNETVDDVLIYATVAPIDGPGKILGSAGPCIIRSQSVFTVIGLMRFDVDDLNALFASGRLDAVILHEMLHVVGFGTLWRNKDLLFGSGTTDPRFSGVVAAAQCVAAEGIVTCGDGRVPLENIGGSGTIESHWRESIFDTELMTGFVEQNPNMPLSAITLASLEDLGFSVNYLSADPFFFPSGSLLRPPSGAAPQSTAPWETLEVPRYEVTSAGWVRPVLWK
jgi:Leishmanolysin